MTGLLFRYATLSMTVLAIMSALPSGALAQSSAPAMSVDVIASTPPEALAPMLVPVENRHWIDKYLRADGAPPEAIARRAAALIRKLGAARATLQPEQLLAAVDQVSHVAARSLSFATVMQLAIASDFRPDNAAVAWDFGPPDGAVMAGFERVAPHDARLAGVGVAALRRNDDNPLLTDGIAGLRRIELAVPDGEYRIILVTQNFGVESLTELPFGAQVRVNGVPLIVDRRGPASWTRAALLTRGGVRAAGTGYRLVDGRPIGDVTDEAKSLYPRQQGGALVIEGRSEGGRIVIEFSDFGNAQSYMTGLIAERIDGVSDMVLTEEAQRSMAPPGIRIALETEILLAAAEAVQGIAPAVGQVLESGEVVTPN